MAEKIAEKKIMKKAMTTKKKAEWILNAALDKKPEDPIVYDATGISPLWEYFIFMTVGSDRQAEAIMNHLRREARNNGIKVHHAEADTAGWALVDFHDVVVHIFSKDKRAFYDLEQILANAKKVVFKEKKTKRVVKDAQI
jgi:ribosome-associated protein